MKSIPALLPAMALLMAAACANQGSSDSDSSFAAAVDAAGLQEIVQLAVLQPDSAEFDAAWSDYLRRNFEPGMDLDAIIDTVVGGANEFRSSARVATAHGGAPRRASSNLRERMQALAAGFLENR